MLQMEDRKHEPCFLRMDLHIAEVKAYHLHYGDTKMEIIISYRGPPTYVPGSKNV